MTYPENQIFVIFLLAAFSQTWVQKKKVSYIFPYEEANFPKSKYLL